MLVDVVLSLGLFFFSTESTAVGDVELEAAGVGRCVSTIVGWRKEERSETNDQESAARQGVVRQSTRKIR